MKTWSTQTIADLGRVVTGKTPPGAKPEQFGDEFPFVTPSDIQFGNKHTRTERFLSGRGIEAHKRIQLPKKTVCVVCIGATIGKVCATDQLSVSNQQINSIIVDAKKHDPDFVFYIASLLRSTLEAYAGGAATPIVNKGAFSKIKLQVPDLPTQRKIAAILTAYDDLIETNRRRVALLEKMAEELYREWFVRMRFPGHRNTKFVKGVPEGWSRTPIGELTLVLSRGISPKYSDESERIVINQKCIRDGEFDWSHIKTHESLVPEKKVLKDGDVLVNSTGVGTLGRSAILWEAGSDLACDSHVTICRADPEKIVPLYLGFAVRLLRSYFDYLAIGATGQTELNQSFVSKTKILVPARDLQNNFQEITNPQLQLAHELRKANENLTQTRDLLLPRLISGKLSVEDPDIQFPPSMQQAATELEPAHA